MGDSENSLDGGGVSNQIVKRLGDKFSSAISGEANNYYGEDRLMKGF